MLTRTWGSSRYAFPRSSCSGRRVRPTFSKMTRWPILLRNQKNEKIYLSFIWMTILRRWTRSSPLKTKDKPTQRVICEFSLSRWKTKGEAAVLRSVWASCKMMTMPAARPALPGWFPNPIKSQAIREASLLTIWPVSASSRQLLMISRRRTTCLIWMRRRRRFSRSTITLMNSCRRILSARTSRLS